MTEDQGCGDVCEDGEAEPPHESAEMGVRDLALRLDLVRRLEVFAVSGRGRVGEHAVVRVAALVSFAFV